jgi:hypothetical protein
MRRRSGHPCDCRRHPDQQPHALSSLLAKKENRNRGNKN